MDGIDAEPRQSLHEYGARLRRGRRKRAAAFAAAVSAAVCQLTDCGAKPMHKADARGEDDDGGMIVGAQRSFNLARNVIGGGTGHAATAAARSARGRMQTASATSRPCFWAAFFLGR